MEKEQELYYANGLRLAYGRFETPNSSSRNLHHHKQSCEILCIHQCKGVFHIEGSAYPVKAGDMVIIQPGEAHYMEVDPSTPYDRTVIRFHADLFDSMDPERSILRPFFQRQIGKRNLYRASRHSNMDWSKSVENMLRAPVRQNILFRLMDILEQLNIQFDLPYYESQQEPLEYRIMQYIKENLQGDLSAQALCERFYISRTQLHQRLHNATGMSVGKYIATRRMIAAQQLMDQGQKPTQVFSQCGFQDYSTFYRAYLRYYGHSPKQK